MTKMSALEADIRSGTGKEEVGAFVYKKGNRRLKCAFLKVGRCDWGPKNFGGQHKEKC